MKRSIITLITLVIAFAAAAQPVKKVEKISEEEVPVAIRQAFINDFGAIPESGTWTVNFYVLHEGARTTAQPTAYTFRKGNKSDRIEVRYSPDGRLEVARGVKQL